MNRDDDGSGGGDDDASPSSLVSTREDSRNDRIVYNGLHDDTLHYELCESCDRYFANGRALRHHILRELATCNIDLGINRTQQEYIRELLQRTVATVAMPTAVDSTTTRPISSSM